MAAQGYDGAIKSVVNIENEQSRPRGYVIY